MLNRKYTLIELLIVVSIISILSSLIIPTLSQTRTLTLSTQCVNNLKNLGVVMLKDVYEYKFPNEVYFTENLLKKELFDLACGFKLPIDDPPEETQNSESTTQSDSITAKPFNYLLDTKNYGCPSAEKNPLFGIDKEPELRSYGFLKYNSNKSLENSHNWFLAEAVYQYISSSDELSYDRHIQNQNNIFFNDASVKTLSRQDIEFPIE